MYVLGHYPAKGSLILANSNVTLDPSTGYTFFSNLVIDQPGMYLLSVSIYTIGGEFTSLCYTNPITVYKPTVSLTFTNSNYTSPNYKLKFNGDFNQLTQDNKSEIMSSVYNYASNYNITIYNITMYSGSIYVAFYSPDTNSVLIADLSNGNISLGSLLKFSSVSVNGVTYVCTTCSTSSSSVIIIIIFIFY
jgi:hypothetical protein